MHLRLVWVVLFGSLALSCDGNTITVCDGCVTPDGGLDVGRPGDAPPAPDAPFPADQRSIPIDSPSLSACDSPCGNFCCDADSECVENRCVSRGGTCSRSATCPGDTQCVTGRCMPFDSLALGSDPACTRISVAGTFAPSVQCAFTQVPTGDAFPEHIHALATPMVADFVLGRGPDDPPRPSIVVPFDDGTDGSIENPTGVIRVIDGRTCEQLAELGSLQLVSHSSPVAIGDLDRDGIPDIVANKAGGGLVAFKLSGTPRVWSILWRSTRPGGAAFNPIGGGYAGPSIADLDDDGIPEVLRGTMVFDANGVLIDESLASTVGLGQPYTFGEFPVIANVDADEAAELVRAEGVYEWNRATERWERESWSTAPSADFHGVVALADFGAFPGSESWPPSAPEVVIIAAGTARVQTLDGSVVFGPVDLPNAGSLARGRGGPPTVGDFDGDGRPEFAAAGASAFTVFDLDCTATPVGTCSGASTTGVLWSQPTRDLSSNVTGSSVFDFEGDGRAEVVYADECFVRVYDGRNGGVLFSQARSSCTWYDNPVIADVDGDLNAEIVTSANLNCEGIVNCAGLGPRNTDPLFRGSRCQSNEDCASMLCDQGYCRCTTDAECCTGAGCAVAGLVCEDPPAGTPGTGKTCRASRPDRVPGVFVFRDTNDQWVSSRPIWNQHAYSVTNVTDTGEIPRTSAVVTNWTTRGLNNFRANVVGSRQVDAVADATLSNARFTCDRDMAEVTVRICNRGTETLPSDIEVAFYRGRTRRDDTLLCATTPMGYLAPSMCANVSCTFRSPPRGERNGAPVTAFVDGKREVTECREANNEAVIASLYCPDFG